VTAGPPEQPEGNLYTWLHREAGRRDAQAERAALNGSPSLAGRLYGEANGLRTAASMLARQAPAPAAGPTGQPAPDLTALLTGWKLAAFEIEAGLEPGDAGVAATLRQVISQLEALPRAAPKPATELARVRAELAELTRIHDLLLEEILRDADEDIHGADEAAEYLAEHYVRWLEAERTRLLAGQSGQEVPGAGELTGQIGAGRVLQAAAPVPPETVRGEVQAAPADGAAPGRDAATGKAQGDR
jgi:hypothetical protein